MSQLGRHTKNLTDMWLGSRMNPNKSAFFHFDPVLAALFSIFSVLWELHGLQCDGALRIIDIDYYE